MVASFVSTDSVITSVLILFHILQALARQTCFYAAGSYSQRTAKTHLLPAKHPVAEAQGLMPKLVLLLLLLVDSMTRC